MSEGFEDCTQTINITVGIVKNWKSQKHMPMQSEFQPTQIQMRDERSRETREIASLGHKKWWRCSPPGTLVVPGAVTGRRWRRQRRETEEPTFRRRATGGSCTRIPGGLILKLFVTGNSRLTLALILFNFYFYFLPSLDAYLIFFYFVLAALAWTLEKEIGRKF